MADSIIGRDQELDSLHEFLGAARSEPGVMLLDGEPSIGKTTRPGSGGGPGKGGESAALAAFDYI